MKDDAQDGCLVAQTQLWTVTDVAIMEEDFCE